jgi:3-oxoisoapionate kinase
MGSYLVTFYGDDFTGSTDAMECLEINGMRAVLFLDPPTPEQLERLPSEVQAVGVAGVSRTMTPAQMDEELFPKFQALLALGAPFVHYKICSTFDSSPTVGSIGHAIEIGCQVFQPEIVPMMVGAPFLRRYVAFGNLFARVGDVTYRLDRHPTMSKHPITPMTESDLRLHLSQQTRRKIGLIDLWHLSHPEADIDARLNSLVEEGHEIILFDTLDTNHMRQIGRIIWNLRGEMPVFLVGSSGFEYSLGMYLQSVGMLQKPHIRDTAGKVEQLLVISGSCAPGTAEQIQYAIEHGFQGVRLNVPALLDPKTVERERAAAVQQALALLEKGGSVVMYSALGPEDPAIEDAKRSMETLGLSANDIGERLGSQQGLILRAVLEQSSLTRVCVAGGDTCGYSAKQLSIYALEMVIPIAPGAPLCRAHSDQTRFDGIEISLKGGQNGTPAYFVQIRNGNA